MHNTCGEVQSTLDPSDVRYTQKSIKGDFGDGRSVDNMISGLKNGSIKQGDVPSIRVFEQNSKIYSLDNRRLYAFKQAGMKSINVQWVNPATPNIAYEISWKFTTINDGISIFVR